jgi:hypothetical protein
LASIAIGLTYGALYVAVPDQFSERALRVAPWAFFAASDVRLWRVDPPEPDARLANSQRVPVRGAGSAGGHLR